MKTGIAKHYDAIDYRDSDVLPAVPIEPEHAMRCARRLYRWALGVFPPNGEALTSGNRYTTIDRGVLKVNAGHGWKRVAHDLSHLFWDRANYGERPHSKAHARFEAKLIREIIRRGYHLEPAELIAKTKFGIIEIVGPGEAKESARAERIARLREREEKLQRKLDRATTALAKIRRSLRAYDRHAAKGKAP